MTAMFKYANDVTRGWMLNLVVLISPVIIFTIMKTQYYRTSDSLMVSCFLTFILSTFLWASGLILGKIVVLFLLLTIGFTFYSVFDKE